MNPKVLWVDDQLDVIKTLSSLLSPLKAEVTCMASATDALEHLRETEYDIILIDLSMPPGKWGGLWFLEALSELSKEVPIIVVSGEGTQEETIKALRLGATDYITKDALEQELVSRVQAVLSHTPIRSGLNEDIRKLISGGEGENLEFKSTLRWNIRAKKIDAAIELSAIKSVAGFLNTRGGTLLIGVDDKGQVVGLEEDRFEDEDKLQLHFWNRIRDSIGNEHCDLIHARIKNIEGRSVLRIDCRSSRIPVYVRWKQSGQEVKSPIFFVRTGPKTDSLDLPQAVQYIADHFKPS